MNRWWIRINCASWALCLGSQLVALFWPSIVPVIGVGVGLGGGIVTFGFIDRDTAAPAAPPTRTPVHPAGRGCPASCCPICGMHDPDHLVGGAHESCVEWLGYMPRPGVSGVTAAEVQAWTPEQVQAYRSAYAAEFPSARPVKGAVVRISRGGHQSADVTIDDLPLPATMPRRTDSKLFASLFDEDGQLKPVANPWRD